jgi:hypothetical protein
MTIIHSGLADLVRAFIHRIREIFADERPAATATDSIPKQFSSKLFKDNPMTLGAVVSLRDPTGNMAKPLGISAGYEWSRQLPLASSSELP